MLTFIEAKYINQITIKDTNTCKIYLIVETSYEYSEKSFKTVEFFHTHETTGEWEKFNVIKRSVWDFEPLTELLKKILFNDEQSSNPKTT